MWFVQQPITKTHKLPALYRLSPVPGPACTGERVELVFWLSALFSPDGQRRAARVPYSRHGCVSVVQSAAQGKVFGEWWGGKQVGAW